MYTYFIIIAIFEWLMKIFKKIQMSSKQNKNNRCKKNSVPIIKMNSYFNIVIVYTKYTKMYLPVWNIL